MRIDRRQLSAGNFVKNNGAVLRTINILRHSYNKLAGVQSVLAGNGISEGEFLDCIHFLSEEGYIDLRDIGSKFKVVLADSNYIVLEAKVTAKGVRLLAGGIDDNMVEV